MFSNRRIYWHRMRHPSEQEEWVCVRSHLEGSCLSYLFSYELVVWNWQSLIRCEHGSLGVCTDSGGFVNTRVPLCRCLCRYRYLCARVHVSLPACVFTRMLTCTHPCITFFPVCTHMGLGVHRTVCTRVWAGPHTYSCVCVHTCLCACRCTCGCACTCMSQTLLANVRCC